MTTYFNREGETDRPHEDGFGGELTSALETDLRADEAEVVDPTDVAATDLDVDTDYDGTGTGVDTLAEETSTAARVDRSAPADTKKRSRVGLRVGGAIAATVVVVGGAIGMLRSGDSEPVDQDRTEQDAGAAPGDADPVGETSAWEALMPGIDGSRQLTDSEVDSLIEGVILSEETADRVTSLSVENIQTQMQLAETGDLDPRIIPGTGIVMGTSEWNTYVFPSGEGIFLAPSGFNEIIDGNGERIELDTTTQFISLFKPAGEAPASLSEFLSGETSAAVDSAAEVDTPSAYPAYDIEVNGVQLPEMINDPTENPFTIQDYWGKTLELSVREGDPQILSAIYEFDGRRSEQLFERVYNQIDEIVTEEGIVTDNLRLVVYPPLERYNPPQETLDWAGGSGVDERESGDIRFGAAVDIHDITDPDNGLVPRQRVWISWGAQPVEGSFANGMLVENSWIDGVDTDPQP